MDDDDIFLEDDEPIVTIPFDPFFDSAIRYKCPQFNQRRTFVIRPQNIHCGNGFRNTSQFRAHAAICISKRTVSAIEVMKRFCPTRMLARPQFVSHRTSRREVSCVTTNLRVVGTATRNPRPCLIHTAPFARAFAPQICLKSVSALSTTTSSLCKTYKLGNSPLLVRPKTGKCVIGDPIERRSNNLCRKIVLTQAPKRQYTHLDRGCRVPEIYQVLTVSLHICHSFGLTDETFVSRPMVSSLVGRFNCRVTEVFVYMEDGHRVRCGNAKYIGVGTFSYKKSDASFHCKLTQTNIDAGTRFRCGLVPVTDVGGIIFGRVWNGRPPFSMYNRTSGRMTGRLI